MARSVRRVVAIPSYKRAYAVAVRPSYLEQVAALIGSPVDEARPFDVAKKAEDIEAALGLTEESSARELLDMLSAGALPEMKIPASAAAPLAASSPEHPVGTGSAEPDLDGETRRRAGVRRADSADDDALRRDLARRETEFEEQFLRRPLEAVPHDPEIAHRVRMFTANSPGTCVVRYFSYGPRRPTGMGAFVFRGNRVTCVAGISYEQVRGLAEDLSTDNAPTKQDSERIWQLLLNPVWDAVTAGGDPSHLIIVPADDIFSIPIHVASPPGESTWPLAASVPLSQSVSATALVGRGRHLLRRQPVDQDDELAAIVVADEKVTGDELRLAGWPASRMLIAGDRPAGLEHIQRHYRADLQGIAALSETKPEFFVYAGHGSYHPSFPQLGPFLELRGNYLTQYDVALRLRLPRNKLTVLGACLAGQGASTSGGDVVGFLRSLIATGAGAVGIPLWSVLDLEMATTVGALLAASRAALSNDDSVFDVVAALHAQYRDSAADASSFKMLAECMPIELYL
jgi:hypothetical protein